MTLDFTLEDFDAFPEGERAKLFREFLSIVRPSSLTLIVWDDIVVNYDRMEDLGVAEFPSLHIETRSRFF